MTLRNRIHLFFLVTIGFILFGFSVAFYLLARNDLYRESEKELIAILQTLKASAEIDEGGIEWEPAEKPVHFFEDVSHEEIRWLVSDSRGAIVDHSKQLHWNKKENRKFLDFAARHPYLEEVRWKGSTWLIIQDTIGLSSDQFAMPVLQEQSLAKSKHQGLQITVAISLRPIMLQLTKIMVTIFVLSIGLWIAIFFAGRWITRRALSPLTEMAILVQQMTPSRLSQRLREPRTGDELDNLSQSFNRLLDRIQELIERQKRFNTDASHQLRTPLAGMLGQIEVVLRRDRSIEEYRRVLQVVQERGEYLKKIIESLLFLVRDENQNACINLEKIALSDWFDSFCHLWDDHPRKTDFMWQLDRSPCWIRAHPTLLSELISVFLENACKFSDLGSPIIIRLQTFPDQATIEVIDQGVGIPEDDLIQLFQPFYRSKNSKSENAEGVGLGLAIAERIVTFFQAEIQVKSVLHQGSNFKVVFPRIRDSE